MSDKSRLYVELEVLGFFVFVKEQKKYKKFYFEKITADMAMTEYYLMDTLNTLPKDSLIDRLHELNRIYFKEIR